VTIEIGERRRVYPGADQAVLRGTMLVASVSAIVAAEAAGARPAPWLLALLTVLAAFLALRPDSSVGIALVLGIAYVWTMVPDPLSPLLLVVAGCLVLVHVGATLAAQGPITMAVEPTQLRRWLGRGSLLWVSALVVWGLDRLAGDLPGGRLPYAVGLTLLLSVAAATTWLLSARR
jgi:hypothetical protein